MKSVEPTNWDTLPLGGLLTDIQSGFASGKHNSKGVGIPHFRPMNVSRDGHIDRSVLRFVEPDSGRPEQRLRSGDVLFNNTNSPELVGKTALFEDGDTPAFSNHMTRLRVNPEYLDSEFLALRLHQAWREGWFAAHCNNHVSQASIGRDVLQNFEIDIPPLEEQQAITKLARYTERKRLSSTEHLASARRAVDRFRQAILVAAIDGRLTSEWRDDAEVDSAASALDRKRRERRGAGPAASRIQSVEGSALPDIPEGWSWALLPELGELGRGRSRHRPRNDPALYDGDYPFVQTGDVARSGGRITEHSQTYNDQGLAQSRLWPTGTVCITIAANIAESGLLTYPACFPDSVVGLIADDELAVPEYIELFVRTARGALAAYAPATAQSNINLAILSEVAVPLPPVLEQREITARVSRLYALADEVASRLGTASTRASQTAQSLLAKAFRGELSVGPVVLESIT